MNRIARSLTTKLLTAAALAVCGIAHAQGPLVNGDFSDITGAPWMFFDDSNNGSVSYATMSAVVTGGDDGYSTDTDTFIQQPFSLAPGSGTLSFLWSYTTSDDPGYDFCIYDVIDSGTNLSLVNGPVILADTDGQSGAVTVMFTGGGSYLLRLGTNSDDNAFGPGVSSFDDVVVTGGTAAPSFIRGDVNDDGSLSLPDAVVILNHLFPTGGPVPLVCEDAGDANDDGTLNITDPVAILNALFGQPAIPLPGPATCGPDATSADVLDCTGFTSC